jgi:hypothetical protein
MTSPFFPSARCNLPSLPEPEFDFVSSCDISPPPGPIIDCPPIDIVIDPPVTVFPCPVINIGGGIGYGPGFDFTVNTVETDSANCETDVSFSLTIPEIPCPTITLDGGIGYGPNFDFAVTIASDSDSGCITDIILDLKIPEPILNIPCPTFAVNTSVINAAAPGLTMTIENINSASACDYEVTVNLSLPSIQCPEINLTTGVAGCGNFTGTVTSDPETCTFDIDLFLDIEDCMPGGDVFNFYFFNFFYNFWYTFYGSESSNSDCACIKCGSAMDTTNVYCVDVGGATWYFNECGQFVGVLVPQG